MFPKKRYNHTMATLILQWIKEKKEKSLAES